MFRLVVLMSITAITTQSQPNRTAEMLRDWADAVDEHRAGEEDDALSKIGEWSYNDLEVMQPFLEAFVGTPQRNDDLRAAKRRTHLTGRDQAMVRKESKDRIGADADGFRKRAAMLHTDAAVLLDLPAAAAPPDKRQPGPSSAQTRSDRRVDVISNDAEYQKVEYANPHWKIAMDMLDAVAVPRDPFVAQWFADIGTYLVVQRRFNDGLEHFDRARMVVPDHAGVLFAEARLHEALSAPLMQNFVLTASARGVTVGGIDDRRTELRRAEALLQKALAHDPSLDEARLRLGRVIMQQGRWDEGLTQVRQVRSKTTDERMVYYANLFAADAELALGRANDAAKSFNLALIAFPESQAARLGLTAAIAVDGKREDAFNALLPTLLASPERQGDDDPWWVYYVSDRDEGSMALGRVRAFITSSRK